MSTVPHPRSTATMPKLDLQDMARYVDRSAFALFFAAVAMPFAQVIVVPLGIISSSGFEFVYLVVTALLCIKIVLTGKVSRPRFALFFFFIIAAYLIGSAAVGAVLLVDAVQQVRLYFPLLLAVLWLAAGTQADLQTFFRYTAIAMIVSAGSALTLNYFFPAYMEHVFENSEEFTHLFEAGRMYWTNSPATLIMFLYLPMRDRHCRINTWLAGVALFLSAAGAFSTLSRTLMVGILALLIGSLFLANSWRDALRRVIYSVGVAAVFVAIATLIMMTDDRVRHLFMLRYFGGSAGAQQIYEVDFVLNRVMLYQQYWARIVKYFPFGQGFGQPYSVLPDRKLLVTDISLMQMILPMGLIGVVVFAVFLRKLWCLAEQNTAENNRYRRSIKLLLVISFLVSFNVDLFTRYTFIVLLALLIMCIRNQKTSSPLAAPSR